MLKSSRPASPKRKKSRAVPPESAISPQNLRALALLDEWEKRPPMTEEEVQAWEETKRSIDESRPHRPLFS